MDLDSLERHWSPLLVGLYVLPDLLPDLAARYTEPHRVYHGIDHIAALAQLFDEFQRGPSWIEEFDIRIAILFHDAIYEPGRPDNEDRSADLAASVLRGSPIEECINIPHIELMIRATKSHDSLYDETDQDLAHFLDLDMAIIGAPADAYDAYADGVRREYASIPAALFQQGRRAFLTKQLARPSLFHTPWFRERFESAARLNLARELASFGG